MDCHGLLGGMSQVNALRMSNILPGSIEEIELNIPAGGRICVPPSFLRLYVNRNRKADQSEAILEWRATRLPSRY